MVWRSLSVLTATLALVVGPLSTAASASPQITGTGTYVCSQASGSITFTPPLTNTGTSSERATLSLVGTRCTGGVPTPNTVTGHAVLGYLHNSCAIFSKSHGVNLKVHYMPVVDRSILSGTAVFGAGPNSNTFTITGTNTGSYPSAAASVNTLVQQSIAQVQAECASPSGVSSVGLVDDGSGCPTAAALAVMPKNVAVPWPWCH
jgi:hypothetical protein